MSRVPQNCPKTKEELLTLKRSNSWVKIFIKWRLQNKIRIILWQWVNFTWPHSPLLNYDILIYDKLEIFYRKSQITWVLYINQFNVNSDYFNFQIQVEKYDNFTENYAFWNMKSFISNWKVFKIINYLINSLRITDNIGKIIIFFWLYHPYISYILILIKITFSK